MSAITLRLKEEEVKLIKDFAALYGETVSTIVRKTMLERIEDELDYKAGAAAYDKWITSGRKTVKLADMI